MVKSSKKVLVLPSTAPRPESCNQHWDWKCSPWESSLSQQPVISHNFPPLLNNSTKFNPAWRYPLERTVRFIPFFESNKSDLYGVRKLVNNLDTKSRSFRPSFCFTKKGFYFRSYFDGDFLTSETFLSASYLNNDKEKRGYLGGKHNSWSSPCKSGISSVGCFVQLYIVLRCESAIKCNYMDVYSARTTRLLASLILR